MVPGLDAQVVHATIDEFGNVCAEWIIGMGKVKCNTHTHTHTAHRPYAHASHNKKCALQLR